MNFNRPDIAKAAGMVAGAVLMVFVVKIILLVSGALALLVLFLKSI